VTLVLYVLLVAAGVVVWGLLSSRFPRLGFLVNGAGLIYLICWTLDLDLEIKGASATPVLLAMGLGWTVLCFMTVGFGLFAAIGGLIEERQRAAESSGLPRARLR
jgi:hypothetical protein